MNREHIPRPLQRVVRERAGDLCEYCHLPQARQVATFHIDHVTPRVEGGPTASENLALACGSCSLRKGPRSRAVDPETGENVPLFHPRRDVWAEHFQQTEDGWAVGQTPTGRATIKLLKMNLPVFVALRRKW